MRLNYDCIHDVLLAISELNRYTSRGSHYELHTVTKQEIIEHPLVAGQYSYDDILYSIDHTNRSILLQPYIQERLWRSCRGVIECEAFFH